MKPLVTVLCLALLAGAAAPAGAQGAKKDDAKPQIGKWMPSLESGITLTQGAYSKNWAGGDHGSVIWTLITNAALQNQLSEKVNWASTLKLAYGQTHQQKVSSPGGDRSWDRPEKSTDLVDLESILRFTLGGFVDPFASVRVETQFQDVSDSLGRSLALNPIRFTESAGIARQFISKEDRSLLSRVGFSFKENRRRFFTTAIASDRAAKGESSVDGGIEWVTDAKTGLLEKRVTWTSKLTVYQPVFYSGKKALDDASAAQLIAAGIDPDVASFTTTIGFDFENILTSQITKLLSVNLYTRWLYDKYDNTVKPLGGAGGALENPEAVRTAIRKAGQFKETLAIGVTYRFL